jgi:peptidoglycan hydrolase CwlO-like protein
MKIRVQIILSIATLVSLVTLGSSASAQQLTDKELKTNTAPVTNSLSYITQLQPVSYEFNKKGNKQLNLPSGKQFGFIADELKQVYPAAITTQNHWYTVGKNNQRAMATTDVDLEKLVPLLVGAVKEQQAEIEKLKTEIQQLKQAR